MPKEERDLLDVLISLDMSADYITGIFISMMFAGHHTSSGTASWALIELMRHPETMASVVNELDELYDLEGLEWEGTDLLKNGASAEETAIVDTLAALLPE